MWLKAQNDRSWTSNAWYSKSFWDWDFYLWPNESWRPYACAEPGYRVQYQLCRIEMWDLVKLRAKFSTSKVRSGTSTVVSERAASSPACTRLRNSKIHKVLPHDQHDLATRAKVYKRIRVRLDRAVPTHLYMTYACPKASCFGREFAFFRRHFYRDPAARGSMAHIEKYIENQNFQANLEKKVGWKIW